MLHVNKYLYGLGKLSPFLFAFQYCFEIYSADNSSSLIKACKTDSEGKVVEGQSHIFIQLFTSNQLTINFNKAITPLQISPGHHDVYRICAISEEERETWIGCIK